VATVGPGAMNLCLGVANAHLDRSPVLALTGQLSTVAEPDMPHQRLPLTQIFAGITKASVVASGAGTGDLARGCLALAPQPPYGPVHLALPSNLANSEVVSGSSPRLDARPVARGRRVPRGDRYDVGCGGPAAPRGRNRLRRTGGR